MTNAAVTAASKTGNLVTIDPARDLRILGTHTDYVIAKSGRDAVAVQRELKAWGVTTLMVLSRSEAEYLGIQL